MRRLPILGCTHMAAWFVTARLDVCALLLAVAAMTLLARRVARSFPVPVHGRMLFTSVLFAVVAAGILAAEYVGDLERTRLQTTVAGLAPTYAHEMVALGTLDVNPDTPPDDPTYLRLIEAQKDWLALNRGVADIYSFYRRSDGGICLLVDSETDYDYDGAYAGEREQRTEIGEAYEDDPGPIERAFAGETLFDAEPTTDRWGTWVSALVPMRRADGTVHSVLGVDYPAEDWLLAILTARGTALVVTFLLAALVVATQTLLRSSMAHARAHASASARQQFLAHMSHEIRTPMTAILGHADLLADHDGDAEMRRHGLATIRRCGRHLLGILDGILDLAKLEAGAEPVRFVATAPAEVIAEVLALHAPNAKGKGLALRSSIDPATPTSIATDPRMLRQILLNLVGNAVKFTARGEVVLLVRRRDTPAGPRLAFAVRDTGPGIATADHARLFRPFTQGDAAMSRAHGGTGLGLAISRHLAHVLGGEIGLASAPGQGSTFELTIPCVPMTWAGEAPTDAPVPAPTAATDARVWPVAYAEPAVPPPAAPTPRPGDAAPVKRVFVVDDAPDNRLLLSMVLQRAGFGVECAADGGECIERLTQTTEPPDLVLMDMQMPGIDGCETTRRLRQLGFRQPIVAVTAHALPEARAECLAAGCDAFLTKPVDRQDLRATIARLLAAPSGPPATASTAL